MNKDLEHLRLLSIFHYVVAAIAGLFALFPVIYIVLGVAVLTGGLEGEKNPPPPFMGWFFIAFGAIFILFALVYAISLAVNGVFLARRKNYTICIVLAGIACLFMPFGTVLGVFTIIVLMRDSVKPLFASNQAFR